MMVDRRTLSRNLFAGNYISFVDCAVSHGTRMHGIFTTRSEALQSRAVNALRSRERARARVCV